MFGSGQIQRRSAAGLPNDVSYGGLVQKQPCFRHAHRYDAYPRHPLLLHIAYRYLDFPISGLGPGGVGIPVHEQQVEATSGLRPCRILSATREP